MYFKCLILGLLLILSATGDAQQTIKGLVSDKNTRNPVPFATVAIKRVNAGINASETGTFNLSTRAVLFDQDTLSFSSIGYHTLELNLAQLKQSDTVFLTPKVDRLTAVTISSKTSWKTATIGKYKDCGDYRLVSNGFHIQAAKRFTNEVEGAMLKNVFICSSPVKQKSQARYRIRVYGVDSATGAPGLELYDLAIDVLQKGKQIEIDLTDRRISLPQGHFFVAIEWLHIPENLISPEIGDVRIYLPRIGAKSLERSTGDTWIKSYTDIWGTWPAELSIEATIIF